MSALLHIDGSLCLDTGAAGWGAQLELDGRALPVLGGALFGDFGGAVTLMELAAVERAWRAAQPQMRPPQPLTLQLRSTAALAVLRWVFPAAPFSGQILVQPPKRLGRGVRDFQPLYDLHDAVEAAGLAIALQHVALPDSPAAPSERARAEMERLRLHPRKRAS